MATTKKQNKSQGAVKPIVLAFAFDKETKGTLRFAEDGVEEGKRPAVGTIYITKEALAAADISDVANIEVTIKATGWDR